MREILRGVIDTNVLVSALIGHGKPRRLAVQLLERHQIVSSRQMLAELADVLSKEKFTKINRSQASSFLSILGGSVTLVKVDQVKSNHRRP